MKKTKPVLLACVSDVHAGGATALCPDRVVLDDGGEYVASKAQRWLMQCWCEYWARVAARRDELGAELYVVFNGDLVDGQVKNSTQVVSGNPNAQAAVVTEAMSIPLGLKPDRIVVVRGTEAHVGNSASAEERIADGLRRDKRPIITEPETKASSWWHFRAIIQDVYVDITHHGRIGRLEHTRNSQVVLYAHDILLGHVKAKDRPPDICLRGHNHKFADSGDECTPRVVATGAWQLKTGYVHKVAADSISDIGGVLLTIRDGTYDVEKVKYKPARGPIWLPS